MCHRLQCLSLLNEHTNDQAEVERGEGEEVAEGEGERTERKEKKEKEIQQQWMR